MNDLRDIIPGYGEAVVRETAIRDAAFLDITESVGKFELRPMTLRDYLVLKNLRCPMLSGQPAKPEDLAVFLWLLSPCYRPGWSFWAYLLRRLFRLRVRGLFRDSIYAAAIEERILEYLEETFQDAAGAKFRQGWKPDFYSDGCYFIGLFARVFHWSPAVTLEMPMKQIFQFMNEIRQRAGQIMSNPSDAVCSRWVLEQRRN